MKARSSAGFTLIEMLVVLAIIGILVGLVSPQVTKARMRSEITQHAAKARYIVEAIVARETGRAYASDTAWPTSTGSNTTSTAYLDLLVQEGFLDVEYAWFAGPGMPAAKDRSTFLGGGEQYNAWCVVADVNSHTPGSVPVVFTRNMDISSLGSVQFSDSELPFGKEGFAFANRNGEAKALSKSDMTSDFLKEVFTASGVTNQVLRP